MVILFLCGTGFAEPSEQKACENPLAFFVAQNQKIGTMTLSINQKKFLFFWIIFNTIGYLSYLTDWHPSITNTLTGSEIIIDEKYYFITPDYINCTLCSKSYSPKAHFYPFHSFTYKTYWGSHVFDGFIGLWGYYDHEEYVV